MITSPYLEKLSSQHQYQGKTNDCGPFCSAIVINSLKDSRLQGTELGKLMEKISWKNGPPFIWRINNWATFPWGIKHLLKEIGIHSRWRFCQNATTMLQLLTQDTILIVLTGNIFPLWSHYKILAAYDPGRGYGFIDPAIQTGELHWDTTEDFEKHWKSFGKQFICIFPGTSLSL